MTGRGVCDWHSHVVFKTVPAVDSPLWPKIEYFDDHAELRVGLGPVRTIAKGGYDLAARLRWMSENGIDEQILSPQPNVLADLLEGPAGDWVAKSTNDSLAELTTASDRIFGLGTLPLRSGSQTWKRELKRVRNDLGLVGVEVMAHSILDAARAGWLEELLDAAVEVDAWVFVHPQIETAARTDAVNGVLAETVGLDMPTEVARAGLVLALQGRDQQQVMLAHGGGTLLWLVPRLDGLWESGVLDAEASPSELIRRRIHVDNLVFSEANSDMLFACLGKDRVAFGSDYPAPFAQSSSDGDEALLQITGR